MDTEAQASPIGDETQISPHERVKAWLRKSLPTFLGILAAIVFAAGLAFYLLSPMWMTHVEEPKYNPLVGEDNLLDCFIARDVSKSPNHQHYNRIEQEILNHLNQGEGDRISYVQFDSETYPSQIQPPTTSPTVLAAQRKTVARGKSSNRTDFAMLFDRLREAIARDRETNNAPSREPHADVVMILSDGVPDPRGTNWQCPSDFAQAGEMFIPAEVRKAFEALASTRYATHETTLYYLVLAGEQAGCSPQIAQEWSRALGRFGLKVVSYTELQEDPNLGPHLFAPLQRHKSIHLVPMATFLDHQEREKFDAGYRFYAQYRAFSHLADEPVTIRLARLLDAKETQLATLFVLNDPRASTSDPQSRLRIPVQSPEAGKLRGPVETATAFFEFDRSEYENAQISPDQEYKIQLLAETADVRVAPLCLITSGSAQKKAAVRTRLAVLRNASLAIICSYLVLLVVFVLGEARLGARLRPWGDRILIEPMKTWAVAFAILLVMLALGWAYQGSLRNTAFLVFLALAAWAIAKVCGRALGVPKQPHLLLHGWNLTGEFFLLPLAAAIAAEILAKSH